jgi:hypothetical protein
MHKARQSLLLAILFFVAVFSASVVSSQQTPQQSENQPASVQQPQPAIIDVIRTRQVEVYDANGNIQVVIGKRQDGVAGIFIPNPDTPLAFLGAGINGEPFLMLQSNDGQTAGSLTINSEKGYAGLKIESPDGEVLIQAEPTTTGITSMRRGTNEEATLLIAPSVEPKVHLEMKDGRGRTVNFP